MQVPPTVRRALALSASVLLALPPAHAQQLPDAGSLRQLIERDREINLPPRAAPTAPTPPPPLTALSTETVDVDSFRFAGNTLLSAEQLAPAVAVFGHRALTFSQLQEAAAAVASVYREAGWIVRTYLPKQDITGGVVTIQVVEAVFGGAVLDGDAPVRLKLSSVMKLFAAHQKTGEALNADVLDRALLLADDLPGVVVAGTLREGRSQGETELVLKMTEEPLLMGELTLDNGGARATGANWVLLLAKLNGLLGLGDQLTADHMHTDGSEYGHLRFTAPVGADGWRLGTNVSQFTYHVVSPEFAPLQANGKSDSTGLEASYPLLRSRQKNLYLQLNWDNKDFKNESNAAVQSDYQVEVLSVGLAGNAFDNLGGGGANSFNLAWTSGNLHQGRLDPSESRAQEGLYTKWRYGLSRQQVLTESLSLYGNLSGQEGPDKLDSSEKFSLGGASGVRAYPSSEGSGSSGQLLNLELRWRLPQQWLLSAFYDWGRVTNASAASYDLAGYGLGLSWQADFGLNLKAVWATRLGSNPNPTATGQDQDGSLRTDRFWLSASLPF